MGDKKCADPDAVAAHILQRGIQAEDDMITEMYLQIVKQLTNNPSDESVKRGFEMLGMCLSCFPPPADLEDFLVMWIRDHAPNGRFKPYTSALHNVKYGGKVQRVPDVATLRGDFNGTKGRFSLALGDFTGPLQEDTGKYANVEVDI